MGEDNLNMRLTKKEIYLIKKAFNESFENGEIYLFGSRVDDTEKGGDIDLYIVSNIKEKEKLREKKVNFLVKLYEYIGEQKIDIVISKDKNRLIEKEAIKGIKL
jgi:predicted nucleotidyltransferase